MSYKLYTDKANKIQTTLQVEGTSLAKTQARVVVEANGIGYTFNGTISQDGVCDFNLPKMKGLLEEGTAGKLRIEVIADDMFFEPFATDYSVETGKKVKAVVAEQVEDKPKVTVQLLKEEKPTPKPATKEPEVDKAALIKSAFRSFVNKG